MVSRYLWKITHKSSIVKRKKMGSLKYLEFRKEVSTTYSESNE